MAAEDDPPEPKPTPPIDPALAARVAAERERGAPKSVKHSIPKRRRDGTFGQHPRTAKAVDRVARSPVPADDPRFIDPTRFLERRPGEHDHMHRGLLLWAMQAPQYRSLGAVGRAIGRDSRTVQGWRDRWDWITRAEADPLSEHRASVLYRKEYGDAHGMRELPEVAQRVMVPLPAGPTVPAPTEAAAAIDGASKTLATEIARRRKADADARDDHTKLIDAGLGYLISKMKSGDLPVSMRDMPALLDARRKIAAPPEADANGQGVESVRVRQARAAGGDVLEAMHADLEEFGVILGALRASKAQAAVHDEQRAAPTPLRVVGGRDRRADDEAG